MVASSIRNWLYRRWLAFLATRLRAEIGESPNRLSCKVTPTSKSNPGKRRSVGQTPDKSGGEKTAQLPRFLSERRFEPPAIGVL